MVWHGTNGARVADSHLTGFIDNLYICFLFQKIETPFLAAVESTLGDRYTPNVENIYKITIKFILETLVDGFEKGGNVPNST